MLNLSSPSEALEPWWIGRSLAGRVRRVDWQFFIASLRRAAISALEEFSDNARVCRRYAKCVGDLWTSQRAEIERVIRNMDNQLAESQHAHDEDVAGLRGDLDKAIDRMMHAETEVECSNAYEVVKAIMSDLETRALLHSCCVSGHTGLSCRCANPRCA
ncbi:hypothetical protein BCR44DRAFT_1442039 [Catenaria anguillulae PL171]|uniref:Uncharacterized protein n=1 Tax=Catenaria anguillulae PL171 TaxID=765915 RepID=A0A1Y2HC53_9FUNG|nr:hypothetical protein BCR44DRAFT_1442039 [Catenaria anguillulae PL171]